MQTNILNPWRFCRILPLLTALLRVLLNGGVYPPVITYIVIETDRVMPQVSVQSSRDCPPEPENIRY